MKKIKIKICEFHFDDKTLKRHFIYKTLSKYYDVEFSDDPDYVFYNESTHEHLKYSCIKIFYTGENITPNFNMCDYAIAFDHLTFGDRYYRYPLYLMLETNEEPWAIEMGVGIDITKMPEFTKEDLSRKTEFCSFIYSNYLADEQRKLIFDKLSEYKRVNAAGVYLNNTNGVKAKNKLEYDLRHKFSIAFENSSRTGYTTEKIRGAITAKTIPIYWGNPDISKEFNEKRFINCHSFLNFDEVLKRVREIDNDDQLYLEILNEPAMASTYNLEDVRHGFEIFLKNIFDQSLASAKRCTINATRANQLYLNEILVARYERRKNMCRKFFALLYKPFKYIKTFESIKQKYFRKKLF